MSIPAGVLVSAAEAVEHFDCDPDRICVLALAVSPQATPSSGPVQCAHRGAWQFVNSLVAGSPIGAAILHSHARTVHRALVGLRDALVRSL